MKPLLSFLAFAALASGQGVQWTIHAGGVNGPTSITHNGFSYYNNSGGFGPWIAWMDFNGVPGGSGNCTRTSSVPGNWYQMACDNITVRVTLSGSGTNTLTAAVAVTNNHTTQSITNLQLYPIAIEVTEATTWSGDAGDFHWSGGIHWTTQETATLWTYASGAHACYTTVFNAFVLQCNVQQFNNNAFAIGSQEGFPPLIIAPGQTVNMPIHFTFGPPGSTIEQLAKMGYDAYNAAYPQVLMWEDRRIVGASFLSDWQWTSATNPRGHRPGAWADFLGAGYPTARIEYLNAVNSQLNMMDMYNPRPQAMLIWDVGGNEFWHVFTYDGNPQLLASLAPELEVQTNGLALIDEAVNLIRNRGYGVGFTLRPSRFDAGVGRPMFACYSQAAHETMAYIQTDAAWPNRGYRCEDFPIQFNAAQSRVECVTQGNCAGLANGAAVRFWAHDGGVLPPTITAGTVYHICNYNEAGGHYQVGTTGACGTLITNFVGAASPARHATWQRANPTAQEAFFLAGAIDDLRMKLAYMKRRWDAKFAYIDTDLFCNAADFPWCWGVRPLPRTAWCTLQAEFPDMLLMPERSQWTPCTADFKSTNENQVERLPWQRRNARDSMIVSHINTDGATYLSTFQQRVRAELRDGMPNYITTIEPPTGGSAREHYNNDLRVTARDVSSVTITNLANGRLRSWSGNPYDGYRFPTKLRIAFRNDANFTGSETTYCEMRGTARCWAGGVEQPTGALNLTGFTHARREYRAWHTDRIIHAGAAEGL